MDIGVEELILNVIQRISEKKQGRKEKTRRRGGGRGVGGGGMKGGYRLIAGYSVDGVDGNLK